VTDTEPLSRCASIRTVAAQPGRLQLVETSEAREPLCGHHAGGLLLSHDRSLHLASQLRALCDQAAGVPAGTDARLVYPAGGCAGGEARGRAMAEGIRDSSMRGLRDLGAGILARLPAGGDRGDASVSGHLGDCSAHGPMVLDRALDRASGGLMEVLNQGCGVELWCENRCGRPLHSCPGVPRRRAVVCERL
jgi:hypothetical protein